VKRLLLVCLAAACAAGIAHAQTPVDAGKILNPGTDSWPSYNGDYTGRRFSTLTKIDDKNIGSLSLAWLYRVNITGGGTAIKGTPIVVDGVMYLTVPDHVWAIDARTGRQIWHHAWTSKGGIHIGNRGVAVLNDALFYETPDCTLVSLNIKDGSERWHKQICDLEQFYYGSVAPMVVKNHIIAGVSGDDLDVPGYLQAHDPVTGEMQWRWYAVPQEKGDPGSDTWPNEEAGRHGGGMTWQPVTYDP
jgi:alcohol dehydrogenase (cytochrome c)